MGMDNQAADTSDFESGYSNEPTETPVQVKEPEPKKAEPKKEAAEPVDPLKEVIARMDKYEASQNKLAGHIGGLTRNQQEIHQLLAASKKATENVGDAPTQAQVKEAMADPKEWAELKSAYPEWAAATEKIIDAKVDAKAPKFDQEAIDKLVAQRVAGETAAVRKELIDSHLDAIVDGDWMAEVKTDAFGKWMEAQPAEVKALGESAKMTDAAKMLRLYQASKQAKPVAELAPEPKKDVSTRQRRFEAAVNPKGAGGHAGSSTEIDDFTAGYSG